MSKQAEKKQVVHSSDNGIPRMEKHQMNSMHLDVEQVLNRIYWLGSPEKARKELNLTKLQIHDVMKGSSVTFQQVKNKHQELLQTEEYIFKEFGVSVDDVINYLRATGSIKKTIEGMPAPQKAVKLSMMIRGKTLNDIKQEAHKVPLESTTFDPDKSRKILDNQLDEYLLWALRSGKSPTILNRQIQAQYDYCSQLLNALALTPVIIRKVSKSALEARIKNVLKIQQKAKQEAQKQHDDYLKTLTSTLSLKETAEIQGTFIQNVRDVLGIKDITAFKKKLIDKILILRSKSKTIEQISESTGVNKKVVKEVVRRRYKKKVKVIDQKTVDSVIKMHLKGELNNKEIAKAHNITPSRSSYIFENYQWEFADKKHVNTVIDQLANGDSYSGVKKQHGLIYSRLSVWLANVFKDYKLHVSAYEAEIVPQLKDGAHAFEICARYKLTPNQVNRVITKHKINQRKPATEEQKKKIVDEIMSGKISSVEAESKYGYHTSTLYFWKKKYGKIRFYNDTIPYSEKVKAVKNYKKGNHSIDEIANELAVSNRAVSYWLETITITD